MKKTDATGSTVYVGGHYEKNLATGVVTKYYYAAGRRIALRQGEQVYYLLGDHLGGTWATVKPGGADLQHSLYFPFGSSRQSTSGLPTDRLFTGQRLDNSTGLYDYGARLYDPALGRFISADSIVSDFTNPQSLNRYAYVLNNPLRYTDPSGHLGPLAVLVGIVALATAVLDAYDIGSSAYTIHLDSSATPYEKELASRNLGMYGTLMAADGPAPIGDLLAGGRGAVSAFRRLASGSARAQAIEILAMEKGISGSISRLTGALKAGAKGADFQAQRTLYYAKDLVGIEEREVFTEGVGYLDIKLTGGRVVDPKDWTGWHRQTGERRIEMLAHLESQTSKYLSNSAYSLKFEFKDSIPEEVLSVLGDLKSVYGDRLSWEVIR